MSVSSGAFVPMSAQYLSDSEPDHLLKRILATGFNIRGATDTSGVQDARSLPIDKKIMYWHEQACLHRVGQESREYFIDKLKKQVAYHEAKQAEKLAREHSIWTAYWMEQDRLAARHIELWRRHCQKKMHNGQDQSAAIAKRVAEANEKEQETRNVRARLEAVRSKRDDTVVRAPPHLSRNSLGQAIQIKCM